MAAALGWAWRVVTWLVILTVAAILMVAVLVPRLAGATPYTILTGSMRPGMPPGTLVVVRPRDPDRIRVGDVLTYQLRSGEPEVVTHRVVAQGRDAEGHPVFSTQGDANPAPDASWVRPVQVKGTRWYAVPYLGYVSELLTSRQRQTAVDVVAGALGVYAVVMFLGAIREPSRPWRGRPGQRARPGHHRVAPGGGHG